MMRNTNPDTGQEPVQDKTLIVGIGASDGGLEALKEYFSHVPADSGLVYMVLLHLYPDQDAELAEALRSIVEIPVTVVSEVVDLSADQIFILPADKHVEMTEAQVNADPDMQIEDVRAPVDIFFRTLAEVFHERAIAVILSGTGANGSMGIKRIKEYGGAVFVQNTREAAFNEMPRNAIATELVDNILPVANIPAKLIEYKDSFGKVAIAVDSETRPIDQQQALREVFTQLRMRTGHDFSNYKRPTLMRRIERPAGNCAALPGTRDDPAVYHGEKAYSPAGERYGKPRGETG